MSVPNRLTFHHRETPVNISSEIHDAPDAEQAPDTPDTPEPPELPRRWRWTYPRLWLAFVALVFGLCFAPGALSEYATGWVTFSWYVFLGLSGFIFLAALNTRDFREGARKYFEELVKDGE